MQPVRVVHKGRGAVSNPQGRFERDAREPVDDGWAREPDDTDIDGAPGTVVTPDAARSIVARNTSPDIGFDASINPYRGCEHGCVYCYARPGHAYLGLSPGLDFEMRLFAKMEAPALLEAELARPGYRPDPIAIGTVTDAWQPVERRLRLTRGCLEVFARTRHPVSLITKSSLVERDLDLLAPMARDGLAYAMVTVTTLDPELSRILEPRAPAPWRRLETIRRLADAGVPVGVSLAPIIPFVNEPEIEAILDAAHAAGARYANYVVLRLPFELVEVVHAWLREHFPDRADRVIARLRDLRGGRDNDPRFGWRMKGHGPWAELIRARFDARLRRWGSGRERPTLRTDLFRAPARPADPVGRAAAGAGPAARGRGALADAPPRQGSLF
ncbi:MAG: PA0069 family radical SAM protein [Burkholderiales bacterium]